MEEQREIDGWSVIAIVEQALGDVECGDTSALVGQAVEYKLVLTYRINREIVGITQTFLHIVGIERGYRAYMLDVLTQT